VATRGHPPGRRVQLHRAISKLGWASRKQAWDWVRAGEVLVDGAVVTDPLTWIDLDRQRIARRGRSDQPAAVRAIALHKPAGVVTTRRDERGRRTVYDLLPPDLPWLHPAGRLDADSEGLLILTNDSSLSARLTDPECHVTKTYHVTLDGPPTEEALDRLRHGIELPEGMTRPAQVRRLEEGGRVLEMVLTEGRNRQVRRMAWAVGHRVRRLVRVAIGGVTLGDLLAGAWRELSEDERRRLSE
jgi:23S rRNA pseudouridine2605 synthase